MHRIQLNPGRALRRLCALLIAASPLPIAAQDAAGAAAPAQSFDCADAFDLLALTATFRCAGYHAPSGSETRIAAAVERLRALELMSADELANVRIAFCPLVQGTGMVPSPRRIYLDDGLIPLSVDGLAEIVAHELEHAAQFDRLGPRDFKCTYVRQLMACGGCQDQRHPLESAAYERQRAARERLREDAAASMR